ncbi:DUF421 domain-containing protein [Atopococcus tabaci]|uniref:DUF421 domain-containing protein n=1 Tax=Atopococcus tabaci TaxID=269774 RepID=UPI0004282ABD|nr:YetF domain-containing protein [Atopococcus tabaci]
MFFSDSFSFTRILVVGILSYILIVFVLRVSGKRTLSKMNSFDFIVTVALGSVLASILTNQNIALIDGITAFALLVGLQFLSSWLSVRFDSFGDMIKSSPKMLYYNGRFDYAAMKKERIPKNEILQAVRSNGHASTEEILAVVLETDGTFSVIKKPDDTSAEHSSLENVSTATDAEQKKNL